MVDWLSASVHWLRSIATASSVMIVFMFIDGNNRKSAFFQKSDRNFGDDRRASRQYHKFSADSQTSELPSERIVLA